MSRPLLSVFCVVAVVAPATAQIELPTPLSHYQNYGAEQEEQAGQKLLLQLAVKIPAESRERALELFQRAKAGGAIDLSAEEALALLASAGWDEWRPELLRLLLHRSRVLDIAPEAARQFVPLIHDSLLFFIDRMSEQRLVERIVAQANLPMTQSAVSGCSLSSPTPQACKNSCRSLREIGRSILIFGSRFRPWRTV